MSHDNLEEVARSVEETLNRIIHGAKCIPQAWDNRVDCLIRLADGSVIGELIPAEDVSEQRVLETAMRLRERYGGNVVALVNEIKAPVRLSRDQARNSGKVRKP